MPRLTVGTCQFPVSADVAANVEHVTTLMRRAKARGAQVVHLPETALTGYAGVDVPDHRHTDWQAVDTALESVAVLAARLELWVLVGGAHRVGAARPRNSVHVVDPGGQVVERYDKRFCSGDPDARTGDLAHYGPGDHACVVDIAGVRCGVLICYEYRFPELYRDLLDRGVELVLHSFHAGNIPERRRAAIRAAIGEQHAPLNPSMTYPGITMPASLTAAAAANHMWISAATSSARHSAWGAFMVRADGVTVGRLPRHRRAVLVTTVDTDAQLYDSTRFWRHRARHGTLHSGTVDGVP